MLCQPVNERCFQVIFELRIGIRSAVSNDKANTHTENTL